MVEGVLIAESLTPGCRLTELDLTIVSLERLVVDNPAPGQPPLWTMITFRSGSEPDALAATLSGVLDAPGWYADFGDDESRWVVYPHKVYQLRRGDAAMRAAAVEHGRTLGIPEQQLDWSD